jgi:hypothetical protein
MHPEIISLLKERYGITLTSEQIKGIKKRYKIKRGPRQNWHPANRCTTLEQDEWIKANAHGKSSVELQAMIKEQFGLDFTLKQIKAYKKNRKINTGLTGRFVKGQPSHNKGKKVPPEIYEKMKSTMFNPGNRPFNWKPVGSERVSVDGYIEIKVEEPNKWDLKHRVVYRQHHGEIPKGMAVIFADGNRLNVDIENLLLVNNSELARLNQNKLLYKGNPEATKVGVAVVKLIVATNKLGSKR